MKAFEDILGKASPLLEPIAERKFQEPSEIQKKSIPVILEGKDVIAGSFTGSGKTMAFAAGLVNNVKKDYGVQGLVLTPTRELAEQITEELIDFARTKDLDVLSVYGGVSINPQIRRLSDADIVVATPGRVLDHIERNTIDLSRVNTLVIDEADRMFDMGFIEDVEKIIAECPNKRQTLLFSATISQDVVRLADKHMKEPVEISAKQHVDADKLEQVYYDIDDNLKYSLLKHLIENEKSKLVMIFCNTRRNVDFVANNLKFMGVEAIGIHGGFTQDKRNRIIQSFHTNKVHVLVATDVAARGLDIKGVTHIYNYDIPPTKDDYTHRIGRTARAGKDGKVINIVVGRDYENFNNIMNSDSFNIVRKETPYIKRARIRWMPEKKSERFGRRERDFGGRGKDRGFGREKRGFSGGDNRKFSDKDKRSFGGRDNRNRGDFGNRDRKGGRFSGGNRRSFDDKGKGSFGKRDNKFRDRGDRGGFGRDREDKFGDRDKRESGNKDKKNFGGRDKRDRNRSFNKRKFNKPKRY